MSFPGAEPSQVAFQVFICSLSLDSRGNASDGRHSELGIALPLGGGFLSPFIVGCMAPSSSK